jgi:hypothetical protein
MSMTKSGLIICVQWNSFLHHLNSQCADTKFTIEIEKEGSPAFLAFLAKRVDDTLTTTFCRKPTDSELYLQYTSNHAKTIKNGIVTLYSIELTLLGLTLNKKRMSTRRWRKS